MTGLQPLIIDERSIEEMDTNSEEISYAKYSSAFCKSPNAGLKIVGLNHRHQQLKSHETSKGEAEIDPVTGKVKEGQKVV